MIKLAVNIACSSFGCIVVRVELGFTIANFQRCAGEIIGYTARNGRGDTQARFSIGFRGENKRRNTPTASEDTKSECFLHHKRVPAAVFCGLNYFRRLIGRFKRRRRKHPTQRSHRCVDRCQLIQTSGVLVFCFKSCSMQHVLRKSVFSLFTVVCVVRGAGWWSLPVVVVDQRHNCKTRNPTRTRCVRCIVRLFARLFVRALTLYTLLCCLHTV